MEFWSVLLTFVSMVDYTEREERLREKSFCLYVSPLHHRRRPTTEREEIFFFREILIIIKIRRGVFTNFVIKQNYTDFEDLKILREKSLINIRSSGAHHRERRNFFFREILIIFRRGGGYIINIISFFEVCATMNE